MTMIILIGFFLRENVKNKIQRKLKLIFLIIKEWAQEWNYHVKTNLTSFNGILISNKELINIRKLTLINTKVVT